MGRTVYAEPRRARWLRFRGYDAGRLLLELRVPSSPPVDVRAIARELGVELRHVRTSKWDGAMDSKLDGRARIFVNANQSENRQRFTIAHEIGHLLLHGPGRAFRDDWSAQGSGVVEIEANRFAADLLMPRSMVSALAPGNTVRGLARAFRVSPEAMRYRLKGLGYRVV